MEEWMDEKGNKMARYSYCKDSWAVNKHSTTTTFNRHLKTSLQRKLTIGQSSTLKQQVLSFT